MAQRKSPDICSDSFDSCKSQDEKGSLECPVCLQTCIHPARLPCGHIFCFLCVKGVANQSNRCALCRADIPIGFLDHPSLVPNHEESPVAHDGYQWFYEGRNGWWQYDKRTSLEIESSYNKQEKKCELLIAGFIYVIDFESMLQIRRNDPHRKRQIKRDIATIPIKGVAGIRTESSISDNEISGNDTDNTEVNDPHLRERIQFPELLSTNIAYQNLDHSNVLDNNIEDSDLSDNEIIENPLESNDIPEQTRELIYVQLSRESVDGIEFDNFIINRIRELNIAEEQADNSE